MNTAYDFTILADSILSGSRPSDADLRAVVEAPDEAIPALARAAHRVRTARFGTKVFFCAIVNAKSGNCSENCAFCAQSGHHGTSAPQHPFLPTDKIAAAARAMRAAGASRFGIVTSGLSPDEGDFDKLLAAVGAVRAEGLAADASPGILDAERLARLKAAGLSGYHHNLETSRAFFPQICTTHDWDEDVEAVRLALSAGFMVCCGGLFGLGESWDDRIDLALTLRRLGVRSVPLNFLSPIPGTPLEHRPPLSRGEAMRIIALYRFLLPEAHLRICGGRPRTFAGDREATLTCGADGLMIGDYLTVRGEDAAMDLRGAQDLGFAPEAPEAAS